ncbi:MAG: heme-binding protein [Gammaproteobacteria bacterium]|nr:heme-binding protein [Gammaproteobacteria bacterium]MDP2139995.1 heme-binding protein [Gammaproteobacteria bacterium]MDP2347815.1 heme-binding protein [Gammaproteobacteria bacterium]
MMKRILANVSLLCGLFLSTSAMAQEAAPAPALTYAMAETAMTAALAEARANNWNLTILVADAAGVPVMIHRMDGASARTYEIAQAKALVVVTTGLSSGEYGTRLAAGQIAEVEGGVTFAGGVPVMRNGEMIGVVTSSGARGIEDEQVSLKGAAAIAN